MIEYARRAVVHTLIIDDLRRAIYPSQDLQPTEGEVACVAKMKAGQNLYGLSPFPQSLKFSMDLPRNCLLSITLLYDAR